jgi:hypothetical protein
MVIKGPKGRVGPGGFRADGMYTWREGTGAGAVTDKCAGRRCKACVSYGNMEWRSGYSL